MKYLGKILACLILVLFVFPAQAEDAAFYYQYLHSTQVPQLGIVSGQPVSAKGGKLGETLYASSSGIVSAAVMDFDGDGSPELLTVQTDKGSVKYSEYAYRLVLYGESGELDSQENAAWVESGAAGGYLTVHIQRSEGKVYIICDSNIQNADSCEWDYNRSRIYTVENRKLLDLTDYEGFVPGNSGVSLHQPDSDTAICYADLQWNSVQTTDYTHLAEYAADPGSSQMFVPREINLSDHVDQSQADGASQIAAKIESVTHLLHVRTDAGENGSSVFAYNAENGCRVQITANPDGMVSSVTIIDSSLYDLSWCLKHIDEYLASDMTEALKDIFRAVAGEPPQMIGDTRSNQDRIVFRNNGELNIDGAKVSIEKAVYTAAAGSVVSAVTITREENTNPELRAGSVETIPENSDEAAETDDGSPEQNASEAFSPYTARTTKKGVNVRSLPDQNSKKVAQLGKGEEVTVTGAVQNDEGTVWYQVVTRKGREGYIRSDLLKAVE